MPVNHREVSTAGSHTARNIGSRNTHQLKHRIVPRDIAKRFNRRPRRHREKLAYRAGIPIQIFLQNLGLPRIRNGPQPELPPVAAPLQRNFSGRLRVPHPLRPAPRRHQDLLSPDFHDVHRRRVNLSALAPSHLQKINELRTNPQPDEKPKCPVKQRFDRARRPKFRHAFSRSHGRILLRPPRILSDLCVPISVPSALNIFSAAFSKSVDLAGHRDSRVSRLKRSNITTVIS
jgi:hypothetical protein